MFKRILLPLDGSQLAELAIPYAEELAGRLGSEVILFHACPPDHQPFAHMHELYLEGMVNTMQHQIKRKFPRCEGYHVRAEGLLGEPAEVIRDYVQKNKVGLVILATRGASGLKVWMLGSVVDKVVRTVNVPTFLVRAKEGHPDESKKSVISRILLPLDGSDNSKLAVPYALEIAKKLKASITLFGMAEKADYTMPYSESLLKERFRMDKVAQKKIHTYLCDVERELRQEGVHVTNIVTLGIDAAYEVLEQEKKTNADLVVMATRGRSPISRWVFGSVAEKVLLQGDLPLLMIRKVSG